MAYCRSASGTYQISSTGTVFVWKIPTPSPIWCLPYSWTPNLSCALTLSSQWDGSINRTSSMPHQKQLLMWQCLHLIRDKPLLAYVPTSGLYHTSPSPTTTSSHLQYTYITLTVLTVSPNVIKPNTNNLWNWYCGHSKQHTSPSSTKWKALSDPRRRRLRIETGSYPRVS